MENEFTTADYLPLRGKAVRLLKIRPARNPYIIECELVYANLDKEIKYFALSYAWGGATERRPIRVNGKQFLVTVSLFEALEQFRESMFELRTIDPLPIWTDAICINQSDDREKELQIPRMGDIYGWCHRVFIWLGLNEKKSRFYSDSTIARFSSIVAKLNSESGYPSENDEIPKRAVRSYDENAPLLMAAFAELSSRPWFKRTWIVQEAALPKASPIFMAGRHMFSFDDLKYFWRIICTAADVSDPAWQPILRFTSFPNILFVRMMYQGLNLSPVPETASEADKDRMRKIVAKVMVDYLLTIAEHVSGEKHDKIYGILGLVPMSVLPDTLRPNYSLRFPVVYHQYAIFLLRFSGNLKLLNCVRKDLVEVPSWVPDFRYLKETTHDSPAISATPTFSNDGRKMTLVGIEEDFCSSFLSRKMTSRDPSDYVADIDDLVQRASDLRRVPYKEALDEWLKMVLRVYAPNALNTVQGIFEARSEYRQYLQGCVEAEVPYLNTAGYIKKAMEEWALCLTSSGRMYNFFPWDVDLQQGDRICILKGSDMPCLLRPVQSWFRAEFRFLGYCMNMQGSSGPQIYNEGFFTGHQVKSFTLI